MVRLRNVELFAFLAIFSVFFPTSFSINCYQCMGSDPNRPFQCNEWLTDDIDIQPESCENVYDAKYCVKHIGRFEASSILCYQCAAADSIDCSDGMIHMGGIEPQSCEHVFEADFCVKTTSLDRGIGAKRYCSSLDLGNYCNYVRQPGDLLTYRTCVYTCTGDGCNSTTKTLPFSAILLTILSFVLTLSR